MVWIEGVGGTPHSGVETPAPVPGAVTGAVAPTPPPTAGVTPVQQATNLLDNKTLQQWNNIVFQDPIVKSNPELIGNIVQGGFVEALEAAGTVTKDANGVYHKV